MAELTTNANTTTNTNQALAYAQIRRDIIYCDLAPGQKLSVRTLEKRLGLGRTPIRESLVRLSEQGLVYTVPQSGTYVSRINLHLAENSRFVREHLERSVAIECCAHLTDEGRETLQRIIKLQEDAVKRHDSRKFFEYDNSFHETLFMIAGRHIVWKMIETHNTHLERFRWLRTQVTELDWKSLVDQHKHMFAAITAGNTDETGFLSSAHLHLMIFEQHAVVSAFPHYFDDTSEIAHVGCQ